MAFPRFGVDRSNAESRKLSAIPDIDPVEMEGVPLAIVAARRHFRDVILNAAARKGGSTNLNRMIQRSGRDMRQSLSDIGLDSTAVRFPEDDTPGGRYARELMHSDLSRPGRDMREYAGEKAIYARDAADRVVVAQDLAPLAPWTAPDDSPASRARIARREAIDMARQETFARANRTGASSTHEDQLKAVGRERAALAEIGLTPQTVAYPEDANAVGWAAIAKDPAAVSWDRTKALSPDMTFERKGDAFVETGKPSLLGEYAKRIVREAQDRLALQQQEEQQAKSPTRITREAYDHVDKDVGAAKPSLAVRAAMMMGQMGR